MKDSLWACVHIQPRNPTQAGRRPPTLPHKDDSLGQYALPFQVSESFRSPVLGLWPEEGSVPVSCSSGGLWGQPLTPRVSFWPNRAGERDLRKQEGWGVGWARALRGGGAIPEGRIRTRKHIRQPWQRVANRLHFLPICSRRKMQHSRAGTSMMPGTTCVKWMFTPKSFSLRLSVK